MSFADYQKEMTPDRKTVHVCFDRQVLVDLAEAEAGLAQHPATGRLGDDALVELRKRVADLKEKAREKSRPITFQSIGRRRWRAILADHPPTDDQREEFGRYGLDHNPETFPAAAMAASAVDPEMSVEEAQWLLDEMPISVVDRVWAACLNANVKGTTDPFAEGSDGAQA